MYISASWCPNRHDHMVFWWKQNADLPHVIPHVELWGFIVNSGLCGRGSIGTRRRKFLVMPKEVLSFALCELCAHYVQFYKGGKATKFQRTGDADTGVGRREAWATLRMYAYGHFWVIGLVGLNRIQQHFLFSPLGHAEHTTCWLIWFEQLEEELKGGCASVRAWTHSWRRHGEHCDQVP